MEPNHNRTGPIGRILRLLTGIGLMSLAMPVYLGAGMSYNLRSLALVLALAGFFSVLHWLISRFALKFNRYLGAAIAVTPVILVWFFWQGGGALFGQGEGGTAAITFIGISVLIDVFRADPGCEVMAIPGLLFGNRTHLACLVFSPIDALEASYKRQG